MSAVPTWAQLVYLLCAVGFILALKGLSGPRTARTGNLIGAGRAQAAQRSEDQQEGNRVGGQAEQRQATGAENQPENPGKHKQC